MAGCLGRDRVLGAPTRRAGGALRTGCPIRRAADRPARDARGDGPRRASRRARGRARGARLIAAAGPSDGTSPTNRGEAVARLRAAGCVWAEEEADLLLAEGRDADGTERMLARREAGEPLEQVLGWAQFLGLRIGVAPGVFVPRRRTELLARRAIALCPEAGCAVDLCCGTGAIGAALLAACPGIRLYAADLDPAAVAVARRNLPGATVLQGDLTDPLPTSLRGRVDVLAANVPYVPTGELRLLPPEARAWEPPGTLDGGADGLDLLRRVAVAASGWRAPGGSVLSEVAAHQLDAAAAAFAAAGLQVVAERDDDLEAIVVQGRRRAEDALLSR
ncbi:MAG: putative protein N(5)-glutamine methyltransferase [Micrococcales bacterium]|nr:putative protein N(5)-glutamine methyltransferase [Micrococcales bacterium]